jgi:hypothetical protein
MLKKICASKFSVEELLRSNSSVGCHHGVGTGWRTT